MGGKVMSYPAPTRQAPQGIRESSIIMPDTSIATLPEPCDKPKRVLAQNLQSVVAVFNIAVGIYSAFDTLVLLPRPVKRIMIGPFGSPGIPAGQQYTSGLWLSLQATNIPQQAGQPYNESGVENWIALANSAAPAKIYLQGTIVEFPDAVDRIYLHLMTSYNTGLVASMRIFIADGFKIEWHPAANITG